MRSQETSGPVGSEVVDDATAPHFVEGLPPAARRVVVVGTGVDDGVRHVIVGKVEAVRLVEGELEHLHPREARASARSFRTSSSIEPRSSAMIGFSPSARRIARKRASPGAGTHRPFSAVGSPGLHLPVGREAPEVVDPDDVCEPEVLAEALDPPAVAVLREDVPAVERVPPELARRAEVVGRHPGDGLGPPVRVHREEAAVRPDVGAAGSDVDRDVPHDPDSRGGSLRA